MNYYTIKYIVKNIKTRTVFYYTTKANNFDTAYKNFKKDIQEGEVISVQLTKPNFKNI